MTCRIERLGIGECPVILRISGQISGQGVDLLRALLEKETTALVLDLQDLLLVDREAVKLLALRESSGVELRNCSAYIREWITKERVDGSGSEQGIEERGDIEDA
jgi:anti-anti-sigma regulatory factor